MKTEYSILWIDDNLSSVETDQEDVIDFLDGFGIKVLYNTHQAIRDEDLLTAIAPFLANQDLDLIVVDYRMPGMNGRQLIDELRSTDHIFLPVIFYSTDGVDALMDAARAAELEGVYFANRDNLLAKIKEVVTSLLNKEHSIKRTRGLLMEGFSEIDATIGQATQASWKKLDETQKNKALDYFNEKIKERFDNEKKRFDSSPKDIRQLDAIVNKNLMTPEYDTMKRWKFLKEILDLLGHDAGELSIYGEINNKTEGSGQPIIRIRNDFAHKTRDDLETSHDRDKCIYVRREITRQTDNIKSIGKKHT